MQHECSMNHDDAHGDASLGVVAATAQVLLGDLLRNAEPILTEEEKWTSEHKMKRSYI